MKRRRRGRGLGRSVGIYLEATARGGELRRGEATTLLLHGRGVGCRRGGMELEEEGTLGRSTGKYYKATTRGGYDTGRRRHGNRLAGLGWRMERDGGRKARGGDCGEEHG